MKATRDEPKSFLNVVTDMANKPKISPTGVVQIACLMSDSGKFKPCEIMKFLNGEISTKTLKKIKRYLIN
jgi:hypothetical protein